MFWSSYRPGGAHFQGENGAEHIRYEAFLGNYTKPLQDCSADDRNDFIRGSCLYSYKDQNGGGCAGEGCNVIKSGDACVVLRCVLCLGNQHC